MCSKNQGTVQQRQENTLEQSKIKKAWARSPKLCPYCYPHRLWLTTRQSGQTFFHSDTSYLSCLLLQFSHSAKHYWEQWFFNYDLTAKQTAARVATDLQLVFSMSTELTGTVQSPANKSLRTSCRLQSLHGPSSAWEPGTSHFQWHALNFAGNQPKSVWFLNYDSVKQPPWNVSIKDILSFPVDATKPNLKSVIVNHRILEPLRSEKTSKIMKSNRQPNTTMPAKPRPKVPHLHVFWTHAISTWMECLQLVLMKLGSCPTHCRAFLY